MPGISSGVLCVIFGIYERLIDAFLGFFINIRKNLKFLFPIVSGAVIGIIIFGNVLKFLYFAYPVQIKFVFIGLILGSIPKLIKDVQKKSDFKLYYLFFTFLSLAVAIMLVLLEKKISIRSSNEYSFTFLIISGFAMSAGVIVPGVSSTLILMLLGVYESYLFSVSTLYFPFLIPLCFGLFIGLIVFMKITKFLLDRFYAQTFFVIIGFTLGSIFVLYPRF